MNKKNLINITNWAMEFIVEVNTTQITDDNGESFNDNFEYLKEKLILELLSTKK